MRIFACVFAIALLIIACHTEADARVIAGDLDNTVAVYYFSSLTNSGHVRDYSGNGLNGSLYDGAQLSTVSGRNCLSLGTNAADFQAASDNKPLSLSKEFSIVAWVRVLQQSNDFLIEIYTYNGPIADISNNVSAGSEGWVILGVFSSGDIFGNYVYCLHIKSPIAPDDSSSI